MSAIKDGKFKNIANELYRPDASVGDGGTAAKLIQEINDSVELKHLQKAQNRLTELNALAKTGNLSLSDWDILKALRSDLDYALSLVK